VSEKNGFRERKSALRVPRKSHKSNKQARETSVNDKKNIGLTAEKQEWVRPELKQLVAGAAESRDGTRPDGGGGDQGS
jgi:hypothetical protein